MTQAARFYPRNFVSDREHELTALAHRDLAAVKCSCGWIFFGDKDEAQELAREHLDTMR